MRIELSTFPIFHRDALPLSYNPEPFGKRSQTYSISKNFCGQSRVRTYVLVREQIYSLSPLTTRPSAQINLRNRFFVLDLTLIIFSILRASGGIRTPDQLITNQLLWPTELHWQLPNYSLKMNFPQKTLPKGYFLGRQR